ncbi:MAG: hypothetical protein AAFP68_07950 [Pseudomonadota bacterium]
MTEFRVREDLDELYDWDVIEERLEETASGLVLVERLTIFDDLTERMDQFSLSGLRIATEFTDFSGPDGFGVMPWETITIEYDEQGALAFRETVFDTGAVLTETFAGGIRSETYQLDSLNGPNGAGEEIWDEIVTQYDLSGLISARETTFDTGVLKLETFQAGIRSTVSQTDLFGDAEIWEIINTTYDANGQMQERFTLYDDGTSKLEGFVGGQRTETFHFDAIDPGSSGAGMGARSWSTIEVYYDDQGRVSERITVNDDGSSVTSQFEGGILQDTVKTDGTGGDDGNGANPWSRIETFYDDVGRATLRITDYDDGRVQYEDFIAGERTFAHWTDGDGDGPGAHDWSQFLTFYDAEGAIQATLIDYDDGDAIATYYQSGSAFERHILDGDGDELWIGRQVTFAADESIATDTFFFDEFDIPDEFFNLPEVGGLA